MSSPDLVRRLQAALPDGSWDHVREQIGDHDLKLTISGQRTSKYGDYRAPQKGGPHRISVNGGLNQFAFLITLVHELAHLVVYVEQGRHVAPHGQQWKDTFAAMMVPYMFGRIFPEDLHNQLTIHLANPKASTSSDIHLLRILRKYDNNTQIHLEDLDGSACFLLENGMRFKRGARRRTRYECTRLDNGKRYFVSALARVTPIDP